MAPPVSSDALSLWKISSREVSGCLKTLTVRLIFVQPIGVSLAPIPCRVGSLFTALAIPGRAKLLITPDDSLTWQIWSKLTMGSMKLQHLRERVYWRWTGSLSDSWKLQAPAGER